MSMPSICWYNLGSLILIADAVFSLDIHYMQYFDASKLAAATISAARMSLQLPSWNTQLLNFTRYTEEDIKIIRDLLLQ